MSVSIGTTELTDAEFVALLRVRTQAYLNAVDAWETAHAKYYRLACPGQISSDLEPFQQSFLQSRRELQELVPRARRLCLKQGFQDPFQLILRVELGANAPQAGLASAIGRGERNTIIQCLDTLQAAAEVYPELAPEPAPVPQNSQRRRSFFQRIYDFFF